MSKPKIPPAPSTKLPQSGTLDPCDTIITQSIFDTLAPDARHPYSYRGFCQAIRDYNTNHPSEGIFIMGTELQQRHELAAFFGNVLHESDELKAGREYLMCADQIEHNGEIYCKPCDMSGFDWTTFKCTGASLASEGRAFNGYCQSNLLPPDGCECDDVYEVASVGPLAGYVKADEVYFGRGAIQLSWNYNYISASVALTGAPQTFCQRPDLVATKEEYAWGAGMFFWMENVKNDMTCHQAVLMNDEFGQTLDIINGGLECPADDHGWHGKAVQLRLNRYCRAASALGLDTLLSLDGCMDMTRKFNQCLEEGNCEACRVWEGKIQASSSSSSSVASANNNNVPTKKPRRTKRPTRPPNPVRPPTLQPTVEPKSVVVELGEVVEVAEELNKVSGPCSGEPCPVPPGVEGEFCRSNDGICGTGSPYCNAESTWTSFCFDCESDSPHGCPTFGCSDCSGETQQCVGNKNGINPISDEECEPCGQGQTYYPCDVVGSKGCWCWDTRLPRVEPAPPSGLKFEESTTSSEMTTSYAGEGVCGVLIDKSLFRLLAPNAQHPFTYEGFCSAIDHYNSRHAEKVFRMGSEGQRLDELIAFLGMVSHETDGFTAPREYLACGDNILVDGELFCMPCTSDDYNFDTHSCGVSMLENDQSYMEFCQPYTTPPKGCNCEYVKEVEVSGQLEGHMKANDIFFGRGSIHISNNFNYIRASATMTGSEDTFCEEPELLATDETYSWGVGLYIWMEFMKEEGQTSHIHALNGSFGSALDIINGAIECPADGDDEWSSKAVRRRLDHYCNVAQVFEAINLLSMDGCMGLNGVFTQCMMDGSCPNCAYYDPKNVRTASPTRKPSTPVIATPPPTSAPKTAPPSSSTPAPRTPPPTDTAPAVTSSPRTRRPTSKPTEPEPVPIRTFKPTLSPEEVSEDDLGTMTNWAMTELKYPPTSTPSANPTPLSTIKPTLLLTPQPTRRIDPANKPDSDAGEPPDDTMETEIVPASAPVNQQSDVEESLSHQVDENTFIFTPLADTTISRTNPDINYGFQPTMVVNMIDGDVALISFDLSGLEDAVIDKAVLRLAILDENTQNVGIFYIQPTINGWTEDIVTYNSAPRAGGPLFASTVFQQDSAHLKLDVTNGVGNHVVSFKIIGTDKMRSEFGSKESSNESNVPALVVKIASQFTSSRPINDSDSGKENPYDLGSLYQGKPSVVQVSGESSNSPAGRISGHIWLDTNRDSVKEADEPGLRGILVDLYSCDDRWITGTRSSSGGDYIFDELSGGNYYVIVTLSADYEFALKNVGPDDSKDSDVDVITGRSDCIELSLPLELSASVDVGITEVDLDSQINESNAEEDEAGAVDYNCRGKPCTEGDGTWCRSEHNYCGTGKTYCNEKSQWTPNCPSLAPTLEPTFKPTTGQPTFVHDEDINCSGEPCAEEGDGTWCRSEIGFCGSGPFYCNSDSTWLPKCYGNEGPVDGNTQTLAEVLDSFNAVGEDNSTTNPTKAPTKSEMAEFSSFALPTLTHISNPKQVDTTALGNMYGIETTNYESSLQSDTPPGTESQNVFTIDHDSFGMQRPDFYAESSWFAGLGSADSTPDNSSYSSLVTVWPRRSQFFLYLYVAYYLLA